MEVFWGHCGQREFRAEKPPFFPPSRSDPILLLPGKRIQHESCKNSWEPHHPTPTSVLSASLVHFYHRGKPEFSPRGFPASRCKDWSFTGRSEPSSSCAEMNPLQENEDFTEPALPGWQGSALGGPSRQPPGPASRGAQQACSRDGPPQPGQRIRLSAARRHSWSARSANPRCGRKPPGPIPSHPCGQTGRTWRQLGQGS